MSLHLYPPYQLAYTGTRINIKCSSNEDPSYWYKVTNGAISNFILTSHVLTIINVTVKDSGTYTCLKHSEEIRNFKHKSVLHVGGKINI